MQCGHRWVASQTGKVRKPTQRSARIRGVWREHIRKNPNREWLGFEFWWWSPTIKKTLIHGPAEVSGSIVVNEGKRGRSTPLAAPRHARRPPRRDRSGGHRRRQTRPSRCARQAAVGMESRPTSSISSSFCAARRRILRLLDVRFGYAYASAKATETDTRTCPATDSRR